MNVLQGYLVNAVVEESWSDFLNVVLSAPLRGEEHGGGGGGGGGTNADGSGGDGGEGKVSNIDDLRAAHGEYVQDMMRRSFLTPDYAQVKVVIDTILECIMQVRGHCV